MQQHAVEISWGSLWRIVAMLLLVVALFYVREVLVILAVALVISSAIQGPVAWLENKRIPRTLSVIVIFLLGAAILALVLYTLIPVALIQFKYFLANINEYRAPLMELIGAPNIIANLDTNISQLLNSLFSAGSNVVSFVSSFLGNVFFILVSLVLAFYLAISKDGVERFIRAIFPVSSEKLAVELYRRTQRKLARWLQGQLVLSALVGVLTFAGLAILGNDYAVMLALLAAVLELIPYVGPITVGVVAFLITLPQSLTAALLVVLVFVIIQQIESNILTPFVMSKAIGLDPVTVVIAMLAGSQLAGFVGIILAVPFTVVVQEVVDEWGARKQARRDAALFSE